MKTLFIILLALIVLIIILFIYCSLVLAKKADHYIIKKDWNIILILWYTIKTGGSIYE